MGIFRILLVLIFLTCLTACNTIPDYASELKPICREIGSQECKEAIAKLLPLRADTFKNAIDPDFFRDRLLSAYAVLLEYPLEEPKESRVFGVAPYASNFIAILKGNFLDSSNYAVNGGLFNYVLSRINDIRYDPDEKNGQVAMLTVDGLLNGVLVLRPGFARGFLFQDHLDRLERAATLVHEARHADGIIHVPCKGQEWFSQASGCDSDLAGPIGFEIGYQMALLTGSRGVLSDEQKVFVAQKMCVKLKSQILTLPLELRLKLDLVENCSQINLAWVTAIF